MGILDYLLQTFNPEVIDQHTTEQVTIPFTGTLRPYQETFVDNAIVAKGGVMVAATGSHVKLCVASASALILATNSFKDSLIKLTSFWVLIGGYSSVNF